jgi:hypothetical protein
VTTRAKAQIERKLPVTAEIGGEGGSYGDATVQAETLKGELGNPRVDANRVGPSRGDTAAAAAEGGQVRESDDVVKHASEPPEKAS